MSVVLLVGIILILVFAVFVYLYILRTTNNDPGIGNGGFAQKHREPNLNVRESEPPYGYIDPMDEFEIREKYFPVESQEKEMDLYPLFESLDRYDSPSKNDSFYESQERVRIPSPDEGRLEEYDSPYIDSQEMESQERFGNRSIGRIGWEDSKIPSDFYEPSSADRVFHAALPFDASQEPIGSAQPIQGSPVVEKPKSFMQSIFDAVFADKDFNARVAAEQKRKEEETRRKQEEEDERIRQAEQWIKDQKEITRQQEEQNIANEWPTAFPSDGTQVWHLEDPTLWNQSSSQTIYTEPETPQKQSLTGLSEWYLPNVTVSGERVEIPQYVWNATFLQDTQERSLKANQRNDIPLLEYHEEPRYPPNFGSYPQPTFQQFIPPQFTYLEHPSRQAPQNRSPSNVRSDSVSLLENRLDASSIDSPSKSFDYKPGAQSARRYQSSKVSQTPKSARRSRPGDKSVDVSDWMPYSDVFDVSDRTNDKVYDLSKLKAYQPNVTPDLSGEFKNLHLSSESVSPDEGSPDLSTPFQALYLSAPKSQSGSSELQGLSTELEALHLSPPKSVSSDRGSQDVVTPFQELKLSPLKSNNSPISQPNRLKELSQPMTIDSYPHRSQTQTIARNPSQVLQPNEVSTNGNQWDPNLPPTSKYLQARFPMGLVYGQSLVKDSSPQVPYGPQNQPFVSPSPVNSTLSPQTSPPLVTPTSFGPQNQRTRISPKVTPSSSKLSPKVIPPSSRLTKSMTPPQPLSSTSLQTISPSVTQPLSSISAQTISPSVTQPPSNLSIEPSVPPLQSPMTVKSPSTYLGKRIGPEQSYDPIKFQNVYQEQYNIPPIQEQFSAPVPTYHGPNEPVGFTSSPPNVSGQRFSSPLGGAHVLFDIPPDIPPVLQANTYVPVTPFTGTPMQPSSIPTVQQEYRKPAYELGDKVAMQYWRNQQSNTSPSVGSSEQSVTTTSTQSDQLVPTRSASRQQYSSLVPSGNKRPYATFVEQDELTQAYKDFIFANSNEGEFSFSNEVMNPEDKGKITKKQQTANDYGKQLVKVTFGEGDVNEEWIVSEEDSPTKQRKQVEIIYDKLKMNPAKITLVTTRRYAEHLRQLFENRMNRQEQQYEERVYNRREEQSQSNTGKKQRTSNRKQSATRQTDESKHAVDFHPELTFTPTSHVLSPSKPNLYGHFADRFLRNKNVEGQSLIPFPIPTKEAVTKRARPEDERKEYVQRDEEGRDEDGHINKSAVIFVPDQEIKTIEVPRSYVEELNSNVKMKNVAMDQRMLNVSTQGFKPPLSASSQPVGKTKGTWGERKALRKQWFHEKQKPLESLKEHQQAIEQVEDVSSIEQTVVGSSSVSEIANEDVNETEPIIHRDEVTMAQYTQNNSEGEEQNNEMDEYMPGNKAQRPKRPLLDAVVPQRGKFPNARQTPAKQSTASTNIPKTANTASKNIQRKIKQLEAKNKSKMDQTQARQGTNRGITLPEKQALTPEVIPSPQVWNEQKLQEVAVLSKQPSVRYVQPTEKRVEEKDEPKPEQKDEPKPEQKQAIQTILGKRGQTPDKTTKTKKSREDSKSTVSSKQVSKRKNPSSQVSEYDQSSSSSSQSQSEEKPTIHKIVWDSQALAEIAKEEKGIDVRKTSPLNRQIVSSPSLSISQSLSPTKQPLPDEDIPDYENVINRPLAGTSVLGGVLTTAIGTKSKSPSLISSQEIQTSIPSASNTRESQKLRSSSGERMSSQSISSQSESNPGYTYSFSATHQGALVGGESPESEPETYVRPVHPYGPPPSRTRESRINKSHKLKGVQPRDYDDSPTITLPTIPQGTITPADIVSQEVDQQVVSKPLFVSLKHQNRNPKQTDREIKLQKARLRELPPPIEPTESEAKLSNVMQFNPTIVRSSPSPSSVSDSSSLSESSSSSPISSSPILSPTSQEVSSLGSSAKLGLTRRPSPKLETSLPELPPDSQESLSNSPSSSSNLDVSEDEIEGDRDDESSTFSTLFTHLTEEEIQQAQQNKTSLGRKTDTLKDRVFKNQPRNKETLTASRQNQQEVKRREVIEQKRLQEIVQQTIKSAKDVEYPVRKDVLAKNTLQNMKESRKHNVQNARIRDIETEKTTDEPPIKDYESNISTVSSSNSSIRSARSPAKVSETVITSQEQKSPLKQTPTRVVSGHGNKATPSKQTPTLIVSSDGNKATKRVATLESSGSSVESVSPVVSAEQKTMNDEPLKQLNETKVAIVRSEIPISSLSGVGRQRSPTSDERLAKRLQRSTETGPSSNIQPNIQPNETRESNPFDSKNPLLKEIVFTPSPKTTHMSSTTLESSKYSEGRVRDNSPISDAESSVNERDDEGDLYEGMENFDYSPANAAILSRNPSPIQNVKPILDTSQMNIETSNQMMSTITDAQALLDAAALVPVPYDSDDDEENEKSQTPLLHPERKNEFIARPITKPHSAEKQTKSKKLVRKYKSAERATNKWGITPPLPPAMNEKIAQMEYWKSPSVVGPEEPEEDFVREVDAKPRESPKLPKPKSPSPSPIAPQKSTSDTRKSTSPNSPKTIIDPLAQVVYPANFDYDKIVQFVQVEGDDPEDKVKAQVTKDRGRKVTRHREESSPVQDTNVAETKGQKNRALVTSKRDPKDKLEEVNQKTDSNKNERDQDLLEEEFKNARQRLLYAQGVKHTGANLDRGNAKKANKRVTKPRRKQVSVVDKQVEEQLLVIPKSESAELAEKEAENKPKRTKDTSDDLPDDPEERAKELAYREEQAYRDAQDEIWNKLVKEELERELKEDNKQPLKQSNENFLIEIENPQHIIHHLKEKGELAMQEESKEQAEPYQWNVANDPGWESRHQQSYFEPQSYPEPQVTQNYQPRFQFQRHPSPLRPTEEFVTQGFVEPSIEEKDAQMEEYLKEEAMKQAQKDDTSKAGQRVLKKNVSPKKNQRLQDFMEKQKTSRTRRTQREQLEADKHIYNRKTLLDFVAEAATKFNVAPTKFTTRKKYEAQKRLFALAEGQKLYDAYLNGIDAREQRAAARNEENFI